VPDVCARMASESHSLDSVTPLIFLSHQYHPNPNTTTPTLSLSMASASSPSSSRLHHPPSAFKDSPAHPKRNSDLFRPRIPDPFSNAAFHGRPPVVLNSELLYRAAAVSQPTRDVILVLGGQCILCDLPHSLTVSQCHPRTKY
jgi:hypothetical protein